MREWLEWQRPDFIEYDGMLTRQLGKRLRDLTGGQRSVPVLIEGGDKVLQVRWQGRTCMIDVEWS